MSVSTPLRAGAREGGGQNAPKNTIVIIGGGPAGLMAADVLAAAGWPVTIYERMASVGRKFLMAGRGGLNLTHAEDLQSFIRRYGPHQDWLRGIIEDFPPEALRDFADHLCQETFVGSSGRVFPKPMKASPMLRAWLARLAAMGVRIAPNHRWTGLGRASCPASRLPPSHLQLRFSVPAGVSADLCATHHADAVLLALGGASWPKLGSDGCWTGLLRERGVAISPLRPSNCGFHVPWTSVFRERFQGTALKSVALTFAGCRVRGEAMITKTGLEGGALYALSPQLRDAIENNGEARLTIDLRPDFGRHVLVRRLSKPRAKRSMSSHLRKTAGLQTVAIALLREAMIHSKTMPGGANDAPSGRLPDDPHRLACLIKACPLFLIATTGIERAISSAGGITRAALDDRLMLKALPGVFAAGEMLDWEAPTGGYLLQASFATGFAAANGLDAWLKEQNQMSS